MRNGDNMREIWKDLKGYEDYYEISNYGNIKRKARYRYDKIRKRKNYFNEKIAKSTDNGNGYLMIRLYPDYKPHYIHRLVAINFIPNTEQKEQVNHKNGNKKDNFINNLEWVTPKENMIHSSKFLKTKYNLSGLEKNREKQKKKINMLDKNNKIIKTFDSIAEASRKMKLNASGICGCCKGKYKSCGGFYWEYAKKY